MTLLAMLDYGLIVLFFGFLAALILVIARSKAMSHKGEHTPASSLTPANQPRRQAYGLVAVLFIALIILTFLSESEKSP